MDVRASRQSTRASVWETRMRLDQVKGGIRVFGVSELEGAVEEEKGSSFSSPHEQKREGEEEEEEEEAGGAIPLKRIGARGGRRRTWQPLPEAFAGPIEVPEESRSESTDRPEEMASAQPGKVKFEFLQRPGRRIGGVSGDPAEVLGSGVSKQQLSGSPGKVTIIQSKSKSTAKSHGDRPKKPPTNHVGQFKIGHRVTGRNDDDEEEEEDEFFDIKEVSVAEQKPKTAAVIEENKVRVGLLSQKSTRPIFAPVIKQQQHSKVHPSYADKSSLVSDGCKPDSKEQHIVGNLSDLVMWRDVPKSAIVFGLGALVISSSSYTSDPNMCFISAISYLGLASLSAMFLYKSIVWRGFVDIDDTSFHELGEAEALCLTKLVLPYLNDFRRKLRALISGDPAITMKLAVVLFVLARCGSFMTMWNVIKLGFFVAFTIPKLWSLYSTQLADQGEYWIEVSQETWDSCPHKKAVAAFVIVLILGFSSDFARLWTGFMLLAVFRYYQQSPARDGCSKSNGGAEEKWGSQSQHSTTHPFTKEKKAY